jgi:hypothetical protein
MSNDKFNVEACLRAILQLQGVDLEALTVFVVTHGININGRNSKIYYYGEFMKADGSTNFGRVVAFNTICTGVRV